MKRKIYSDPEEVRKELQAIADELNLPINDEKVGFTWTGDGKSMTPEVMQEVLVPLYLVEINLKSNFHVKFYHDLLYQMYLLKL